MCRESSRRRTRTPRLRHAPTGTTGQAACRASMSWMADSTAIAFASISVSEVSREGVICRTTARAPAGVAPPASQCRQRRAQLLARALAPPALLGAEAAVRMVVGVELALVGARPARSQARLERVQLRWRMRIGLAAEDAQRAIARVRAVEAQADAADEVTDLVLAEAGVCASRAGR